MSRTAHRWVAGELFKYDTNPGEYAYGVALDENRAILIRAPGEKKVCLRPIPRNARLTHVFKLATGDTINIIEAVRATLRYGRR